MTDVQYQFWDKAFPSFDIRLEELVRSHEITRVCDIGGGADPALDLADIERHGLDYVVTDIEEAELEKAPQGYQGQVLDACAELPEGLGTFDLVFSRLVAEHIPTPDLFHANILRMLEPGGVALHFFPTLYSPPFLANRLLPEGLTEWTLHRFQQGRSKEGPHGKFPAYYRWCRAPTSRQRGRFERLGYEIDRYTGFFGHGYLRRTPPLHRVSEALARRLVARPVPALTSFALMELRKPHA